MKKQSTTARWIALLAMGLGVFMGLLDVTVVNVALPTMVKGFNTTFTNLQWVLNAYTLVYAVTLMIMSKLGDMYGRKKIFLGSLILFVIASAINGMAPSLLILDLGRGVQAIGGAGMMSLSMALVASNFDGKERGLALGILGSIIGVSSASGPLIGGYLVEHFGWPAIFYVNVPFGIIAVILTVFYVRETPSYGKNHKIDLAGMILSAIGLFAIIYGLIVKEGHPHWAWTDPQVLGLLAGGIIVMIAFVFVEARVVDPMIDLKMFKRPHFLGTIIVAFALGSGIYAYNAFLTALMQNYIGYSAVQTGVRQLTISAWSLVLGPVAGILSSRYSKKWMIVGSLLIGGVGFFLMAHAISPTVTFAELWPGMILMGITNGMVNPLLNTAGMEGALPQEMGMVSGLLNVFRQFGTTVGVVGLGLIQDAQYEAHLNAKMPMLEAPAKAINGIKEALINAGPFSGHTIAFSARMDHLPFAQALQKIVIHAYDNGMAAVSMTSAIIVIVGAIGAALLMRNHMASQDLELKQK
ncbi:Multidrug resistance protein stp [Lentilactobacillus parabuchneri]|jgi:EmrB/QacA subfamily drug resistance transporter|uniref:DHA2 family efflux MFS transporter permease subunit n=4 Tax=Lentilactobacillus TaxID=2767893 RepID=A0A1X1FFE8_9LACO|nr:MFS transporter [Lentilactobacillus parabuchneri]APR07387.1 Multidrug resistance protein stp [Lentilactobacillus parabuchneri]KRM47261.1 drug resistance transporter, EmrB QacA subfamily protein [Lentilactobacillus parabuchneri DSM 5707 = NBRC 107865]KRN79945.1 drug resistance transporter, EmrB QacA subfamily protein [Lentilactobacillus parabuchneri]MBW0223118.1 MFS transporter [Lentilactobacillus parabuchneri]MBW0245426.1 MFS transporter [Lentilactobacillus parabuchneri]